MNIQKLSDMYVGKVMRYTNPCAGAFCLVVIIHCYRSNNELFDYDILHWY